MTDNYYVRIIQCDAFETEKEMGPFSAEKAAKVDAGVNINLDHYRFFTKIIQKDES